MTQHTSQRMRSEDGIVTVTSTMYDDNDKPIDGETLTFDTQAEAEEFMTTGNTTGKQPAKPGDTRSNGPAAQPNTDHNGNEPDIAQGDQSNTQSSEAVHEKPASQMTEADAVALNADVHIATPNTDTDRVVTDGEKDQVEAGLHPKPEAGNPEQKEDNKQ